MKVLREDARRCEKGGTRIKGKKVRGSLAGLEIGRAVVHFTGGSKPFGIWGNEGEGERGKGSPESGVGGGGWGIDNASRDSGGLGRLVKRWPE